MYAHGYTNPRQLVEVRDNLSEGLSHPLHLGIKLSGRSLYPLTQLTSLRGRSLYHLIQLTALTFLKILILCVWVFSACISVHCVHTVTQEVLSSLELGRL